MWKPRRGLLVTSLLESWRFKSSHPHQNKCPAFRSPRTLHVVLAIVPSGSYVSSAGLTKAEGTPGLNKRPRCIGKYTDCQQLTRIVRRARIPVMNVNLGAVFDNFIADLLKTGLYQSQSEIVREGLRLLKEREELKNLRLGELRKEIAVGSDQADRGEFVDGEKAFAEIRRRSAGRQRAGG